MNIHFEELNAFQRSGGIEAATKELVLHLGTLGVKVTRSPLHAPAGRPDAVHFHGIWPPPLAGRFFNWLRQGVPCLVTPHGMLETWALSHKPVKKKVAWHLYQRYLLNRAAVLHGTSKREISQFKKLGLTPPVALVPWGVSLPAARPEKRSKNGCRTALFVGRIYPVKGLPMLVEAWARVRPAGWKLLLVGPDEAGHRAEVAALVSQHGLAPAVEFGGELAGAAKAAAYRNADLFIMPSYTENFGMAIVEALAHGLPVLTTTGTPWADLTEQGCGWWVAPTVEAISAALAEAVALEESVLRDMGSRGRDWVARDFTWSRTAVQMKELYSWVLDNKTTPGFVKLD